jgi:hypothetical protein
MTTSELDAELAVLRRELEYARRYVANMPLAERVMIERTTAAEIALGYIRSPEQTSNT